MEDMSQSPLPNPHESSAKDEGGRPKVKSGRPLPDARESSAGRGWLAGMGLFLAAAGLLFTWVLWRAYTRAEETRSWVETPCVILSSRVVSERPTPNSNLAHRAELRYEYDYGGQTRTGSRVKRVEGATAHEERAQAVAAAYPAGARTVCYVNPAQPDEAILKRGSRGALYSIWFPLLFVVGGAGMVWNALRRAGAGVGVKPVMAETRRSKPSSPTGA